MANKFNITITATDRATAVVRKFNDQIARITRSVSRSMESFRKLGKEIGQNKIVKGLATIAKGAGLAASKIFSIGGALTGIGLATSAVALVDWAKGWAISGAEVARTSAITGLATGRLQALRGAARIAGLSADDMTGSVKALGDTMEDALYGRNQQALALMTRLGIHLKRTKDGAVDTAAGLYDIADAIAKIKNVQAQGVVARTFGVESILPLLQGGSKGLRAAEAQAAASGAVLTPAQIAAAKKTQGALANVSLALDGVSNAAGERFTPIINAMADSLTNWAHILRTGRPQNFGNSPAARAGSAGLRGFAFASQNPIGAAMTPLVALVRYLEGSGDKAISRPAFAGSRGGAVGRFQIMPDTARRYGFDPAQLTDPKYSERVARTILADLSKRYHGDLDDILVGYNSTPGYVKKFNKAGHNPSVLLPETQAYLRKAHGNSALMSMLQGGGAGGAAGVGDPAKLHVVVDFKNAPPGTTAAVKSATGGPVKSTVRVDYAMQDLSVP